MSAIPKADERKLVGIWIRVSTEDEARGESPEHYEKRARVYAEVRGWGFGRWRPIRGNAQTVKVVLSSNVV